MRHSRRTAAAAFAGVAFAFALAAHAQDEPRRTAAPARTTESAIRAQTVQTRAVQTTSLSRMEDVPYAAPQRAGAATAPAGRTVRRMTGPTRTARSMTGPLYDLPLMANDLPAGARNLVGKTIHSSSGTQMWGYDIGQMRWNASADTWSEVKSSTNWNDPKNSDFYTYGQRVYAAGPGRVIRCWRNAPENPRPYSSALGDSFDQDFEDRAWLHPQWRARRMSGGGNHLLVEEEGGNWILYAHAQPGTIPSALCPHNAQLYSAPNANSEADVPEAQQATIAAGQFLFNIGNSGNSSAPHLHIHMQDPDENPVQFRFRRGLSTKLDGNKADINSWTSFSGQPIPAGPVLFWPPTRLSGEYARHGFAASDFQRMFDHLANSGFWPEWIDAYSVAGKPYLNFVWRPAQNQWRAFFLVTGQKYQNEFEKAANEGYSPVQVESSLVNGQVRYTVIFAKGQSGAWLARHGLTTAQHDAVLAEAQQAGMSPMNVSVVSVNGQRRYTVLYRQRDIGSWQMKSQTEEKDYQALYTENAQAGRRPYYVNAYMHGGKPYISAIFASKPTGQRKDRHGMSASQYQQEFNSAMSAGLGTRAVSSFDGAQSQHRYIAIWRK